MPGGIFCVVGSLIGNPIENEIWRPETMHGMALQAADRVDVMILIDNYTDVLSVQSTEVVKRPVITPSTPAPVAQHGLSCLLKVCRGSDEHYLLMDAGRSSLALLHNMEVFHLDPTRIECIVLSHGHPDHFGGLMAFLEKAEKGIPLLLHPDAFLERRLKMPGIGYRDMPRLDEEALKTKGADIQKRREAVTACSDLVLISGETERVTDFEKGFPLAEAKVNNEWMIDPFLDDQAVIVNVEGRGLVVIGGCSHAGIINIVQYARKLTGIDKVCAVLGGFHLAGPVFEPIIKPTISAMKDISPDFIVPMHCTGWQAITEFSTQMPEAFILNIVGTTYVFK